MILTRANRCDAILAPVEALELGHQVDELQHVRLGHLHLGAALDQVHRHRHRYHHSATTPGAALGARGVALQHGASHGRTGRVRGTGARARAGSGRFGLPHPLAPGGLKGEHETVHVVLIQKIGAAPQQGLVGPAEIDPIEAAFADNHGPDDVGQLHAHSGLVADAVREEEPDALEHELQYSAQRRLLLAAVLPLFRLLESIAYGRYGYGDDAAWVAVPGGLEEREELRDRGQRGPRRRIRLRRLGRRSRSGRMITVVVCCLQSLLAALQRRRDPRHAVHEGGGRERGGLEQNPTQLEELLQRTGARAGLVVEADLEELPMKV